MNSVLRDDERTRNRCEIVTAEGRGYGFFNFGRADGQDFKTTLRAADLFLTSLGYLREEPTLK